MKKIFIFSTILLLAISLTGCGKKGTVTCTLDNKKEADEIDLIIPKYEVLIDYEGSKITKITGNYILKDNDEAKKYYDEIYEMAVADNAKTNFTLKNNKILNVTSQNDIIQLATGNINEKKKDKIVDGLKKVGYTCK